MGNVCTEAKRTCTDNGTKIAQKRGLTPTETVENVCTEGKRPRTENGTQLAQKRGLTPTEEKSPAPGNGAEITRKRGLATVKTVETVENVSTEEKSPGPGNGTEMARKRGLATVKKAVSAGAAQARGRATMHGADALLPRQQKQPFLLPRQDHINCGALQPLCTPGVLEGGVPLGYSVGKAKCCRGSRNGPFCCCGSMLPLGKFCTDDGTVCRCNSRALWTFGRRSPSRPPVLRAGGCLDGLTAAATKRMSCLGPVTAGRTPAVVRPTAGACVPSMLRL